MHTRVLEKHFSLLEVDRSSCSAQEKKQCSCPGWVAQSAFSNGYTWIVQLTATRRVLYVYTGTRGQIQEITAGSGKVPLPAGAVGGLSTATYMKQRPAFLLQILTTFWGWGNMTSWSKGPAHARGMRSAKAVDAVRQEAGTDDNHIYSLCCSSSSDALCPHPLTNHQVHVVQACWRIILW